MFSVLTCWQQRIVEVSLLLALTAGPVSAVRVRTAMAMSVSLPVLLLIATAVSVAVAVGQSVGGNRPRG